MSSSRSRDRGRGAGAGGRGGRTCYRCGGEGHIVRDCHGSAFHTDLGGGSGSGGGNRGESVDPSENPSLEPTATVRGRGESKFYEGEEQEQEQDTFARQEVRPPPPLNDESFITATEPLLDWAQPAEEESSTRPAEIAAHWKQPHPHPHPHPQWRQPKDEAFVAEITETPNWEQPHAQRERKGAVAASSSSAPTPHLGGLAASTALSKEEHSTRFDLPPQQNLPPSFSFSHTPNPISTSEPLTTTTDFPTTNHFPSSPRTLTTTPFPIMTTTPHHLGDKQAIVFVSPKEGYENLRQRLKRVFALDDDNDVVEIRLGIKWRTDDRWFPERTLLDEGNFEGAVALVGRRWGGDVLVVFRGVEVVGGRG